MRPNFTNGEVTNVVQRVLHRVKGRFRSPDPKSLVWLIIPQLQQEGWGAEKEEFHCSPDPAAPAWVFRR